MAAGRGAGELRRLGSASAGADYGERDQSIDRKNKKQQREVKLTAPKDLLSPVKNVDIISVY